MEKIINELPDHYLVSYTNFRRYALADYESFVHIMFQEAENIDESGKVKIEDIMKEYIQKKVNAKL